MGLDNYLSIYSKRIELSEEIVEALKQKDIVLCEYNYYSFRGKSYNAIVDVICNNILYCVLYPATLGYMAIQIDDFLKLIKTEGEIDVRDYINDYDDTYCEDRYKITKKELESLRDLFQFCYENNLYLHDDF